MFRIPPPIAAIVAAALCAAAMAGCGTDGASHAAERPAAAPITWREIGSWAAKSDRQTESFEVSFSAMRLRWRTANETTPGAGRFTVTLHSAVSGRPLQTVVDATGVGSATVDIADEPRWCYFVVDAANVEWQMTLEQGYAVRTP